ncbi:uncharacterized protein LOC106151063 [Lingula anatina]|uniref:Uncharacterized protein LOC106151063 n=1 Tax=Lingula anatina TaxID=7574 RepID=A0A1S3H0Z7_LINAN|nr:uncharacterized protein LOC106151063 [Lingula anatina]|eukprot:XP_013379607.1 uncharacterized protein LOC106151063 [Lingula anatina]
MASCKNDLFYPVLPPNQNAVCNSKMTEEGNEGVAKFILTNDDSDQSLTRIEKDFHLKKITIATHFASSLDDLKSTIESYIEQHKACLVDGVNEYEIKLVLKHEWEEMINKLQLEDGDDIDLRLYHIEKKSHNFFMLAKNVGFLKNKANRNQSTPPFAVFLQHSVMPKVEIYAYIYFKTWASFQTYCEEHDHAVRGHIFNCLVALSNGGRSYVDNDGHSNDLTDGSSWVVKNNDGFGSDDLEFESGFKKISSEACHICIGGTKSDYRLFFWNQMYHSKTENRTITVYLIDSIGHHTEKKLVKKRGDRHSKESQSSKCTADPQIVERDIKKIKLVFVQQSDKNPNKPKLKPLESD